MAGGENVGSDYEFHRLFERKSLDVAQPSVTKIGGVTELNKVFALRLLHPTNYGHVVMAVRGVVARMKAVRPQSGKF